MPVIINPVGRSEDVLDNAEEKSKYLKSNRNDQKQQQKYFYKEKNQVSVKWGHLELHIRITKNVELIIVSKKEKG